MSQWFEIDLDVPISIKDSVINRLFEIGAQGVSEGDPRATPTLIKAFFEASLRPLVEKELRAYLKALTELFPSTPPIKLDFYPVTDEAWGERYKTNYPPQRLSRFFFLCPAFDTKVRVPEEMLPIVMEPGQAFGTGLHASTRLSLSCLEQIFPLYPDPRKTRILDAGTGSGILAIAAYQLGFRKITAIDYDSAAIETAGKNFELNKAQGISLFERSMAEETGVFDVILANILLETHLTLLSHYRRSLPVGGQLILSGLLADQVATLREAIRELGFIEELCYSLQEWSAIAYTAI